MLEQNRVVIIGAGQAGLATSYELGQANVEHIVLERNRIAESWRRRWDSFCLVTPNWSVTLPGGGYQGDDPGGFMPRDAIVAYFERYASGFSAPVHEGINVTSLEPSPQDGFVLHTSTGSLRAECVVIATGAYQRPYRPAIAGSLPVDLQMLDVDDYRNPSALAPGKVLVIGSGQSGCQIAEELQQAGREVFLACGKAPWAPRRIAERDIFWWVAESGFLDAPPNSLPTPHARLGANALSTGKDGGRDLHLRTLRARGVTLLGRFLGAEGRRARFAADLGESVAWGDERFSQLMGQIRKFALERGLPDPKVDDPEPFDSRAPEELDLNGFGAVIFARGFRPDYAWVKVPAAFDDLGFPRQVDGNSSAAKGLYFIGVPFLRKRKSSLLFGVGEDAAIIARSIAKSLS